MTKELDHADKLVTIKEAAAYFNMTENALRCRYRRGGVGLPALHRIQGSIRLKLSEVLATVKPN